MSENVGYPICAVNDSIHCEITIVEHINNVIMYSVKLLLIQLFHLELNVSFIVKKKAYLAVVHRIYTGVFLHMLRNANHRLTGQCHFQRTKPCHGVCSPQPFKLRSLRCCTSIIVIYRSFMCHLAPIAQANCLHFP